MIFNFSLLFNGGVCSSVYYPKSLHGRSSECHNKITPPVLRIQGDKITEIYSNKKLLQVLALLQNLQPMGSG